MITEKIQWFVFPMILQLLKNCWKFKANWFSDTMVFATIVSEFHFVTAGFYITVAVFTLAALLSPICTCRNNLEQNSTFTHKKKTEMKN